FHKKPITSVEWHPSDEGVFAAASEDDQITLWDITLEQDTEVLSDQNLLHSESEFPVQLLFVHHGQNEIKELHWHPQVPGLDLH
ncbi:unnamed protein product, partial [Protopolystoma xenopodis]